ncbi:MAG: hypothetical protein RR403_01745 [Pseudoflavonifractor sp.]
MTEPMLFGFPLSLLFLYFMVYAFLGWVMETTYCSLGNRRFVARGFLYGPLCPIYGVGVLMMICWFAPLTGHPLVFYLVSVVAMSAWEYLVGWFLEVTTHIKYWDYSNIKFNLHGRICLPVSLTWGLLSYGVIFWLHPLVGGLIDRIPLFPRHIIAIVLFLLLAADAVATIRELMLVSRMLTALDRTGDELRLQLALGKAELADRLEDAKDNLSDRLEDARDNLSDRGEALRMKYNDMLDKAERQSRHLRYAYGDMTSKDRPKALEALREASRKRQAEKQAKKAAKKARK